MRVLDPDACLGTRSFWVQEAGKPGLHEESQPMAKICVGERQEFRVVSRLPPFPQAAARLALFLQDVQVLLQEDLHDLQEPLLACQAHAQTDEQRAALDLITSEVAGLDEMLSQRLEFLKEHWQREMAVISDDGSQVREPEIAVPG
ncbi:MAG TPA: hypothetical protein VFV38_25610 [Ktedonobacteraceae bacterium]|nr:hypothetical protein [Ktedonobacteraceae bacterium]